MNKSLLVAYNDALREAKARPELQEYIQPIERTIRRLVVQKPTAFDILFLKAFISNK